MSRSVIASKSKYFTRIYFLRTWKHKIVRNNLTRVADLISAGIVIGGLVCKYAGYAHVLSVPSWATLCNINPAANYQSWICRHTNWACCPSKLGVPAHKLGVLTAQSGVPAHKVGMPARKVGLAGHSRFDYSR